MQIVGRPLNQLAASMHSGTVSQLIAYALLYVFQILKQNAQCSVFLLISAQILHTE